MSQDDSQRHEPPPLDYRAREADRIDVSGRQALGGCALACVVMFITFIFGIDLAIKSRGWFIAPVLIAAVIMAFFAIKAQRMPDRRGLAIGLWIGLGISVLLSGLCFIGAIR
jgi:hypothetical protein